MNACVDELARIAEVPARLSNRKNAMLPYLVERIGGGT